MKTADGRTRKGTSLAKGPAALVGLAMIAFGVLAFIFGANNFGAHPLHGTVNGDHFLGLEVNGWDAVLFAGGGALLLFAAPLHWGAKTMSIVVGGVLGAAALIALDDGQDVYGVLATNWLTKLVFAGLAALLLVIALLPRVGRRKGYVADDRDAAYDRDRDRVARERPAYGDAGYDRRAGGYGEGTASDQGGSPNEGVVERDAQPPAEQPAPAAHTESPRTQGTAPTNRS